MAQLDEGAVEKKFKNASTSQDNIQSLTLWVLHHKQQHEQVVGVWFKVLKKSKVDHRLVLFYVCNDIVQTCRKKHAIVYKDAFKEVLKDAALLVRDSTIKGSIERIFAIWAEREVYEQEFCDELIAILNNAKLRTSMSSKLLAEFQPIVLMEKIITQKRLEDDIESKRRQLINLRLDASSIEAVKQLKDRTHGKEFCSEFEGACKRLDEFVNSLEREMAERTSLVELLEQSELYYDGQYGEAKIVANAYKNFGNRVSALEKKLCDKLPTLEDGPELPVSPGPEAPEPEPLHPPDSPTLLKALDKGADTQAVDMDLSDDDTENLSANKAKAVSSSLASADAKPLKSAEESLNNEDMDAYSPQSDDSIGGMSPVGSPIVDKDDGKASLSAFLSALPSQASTILNGESKHVLQQIQTLAKPTAFTSEGGSTPVMDEEEESQPKAPKSRPIDFLTQLIGQSSKDTPSSGFLQSLSMLTSSVAADTQHRPPQTTWGAASSVAPMPPPPSFPPLPSGAVYSGGFQPYSTAGQFAPPTPPAVNSMAPYTAHPSQPPPPASPLGSPPPHPPSGPGYTTPPTPQTPRTPGLLPAPTGSWESRYPGVGAYPPATPAEYNNHRGSALPPPPRPFFAQQPPTPPGPPSGPPPPPARPSLGSNGQEEFAEKLRRKTGGGPRTLARVRMEGEGEEDEEGMEFDAPPPPPPDAGFRARAPYGMPPSNYQYYGPPLNKRPPPPFPPRQQYPVYYRPPRF